MMVDLGAKDLASERDSDRRARICLVGPMGGGGRRSHVPTQADLLPGYLRGAGYATIGTSTVRNRYLRFIDIARTLIVQRNHIDVQCLQVFGGRSFVVEDVASFLGRLVGHRIVMHLRGGGLPEFVARFPRWTRRVFGRAHSLVAPSDYLAEQLCHLHPNIQVISNVLRLERYPYRQRMRAGPRLLWMRAFHRAYNPEMAVRVLFSLLKDHSDARLTMAGPDRGTESEVRSLVRRLGLERRVRFVGFLDLGSKVTAATDHDIYLVTNRVDNTPVSVLEMGALGLPIVSTSVGGLPFLLKHKETALMVPDGDHESMANEVRRLIQTPELVRRLSAAGRRLAEKSEWELVRPQWESLLQQVMNTHSV